MARSDAAKSRSGKRSGCLAVFFLPFAAAGCAVIWFAGLGPWLQSLEARDWPSVPCRITHSAVAESRSDDGTTYRIDIHFTYEVDGRRYSAETYGFSDIGTSGRSAKQAVVDRHPVGSETVCYVDPDDPGRAVLQRGAEAEMLWGLFGLPFLLIGLGGFWFSLRGPRLRSRARSAAASAGNPFREQPSGSADRLRPSSTPRSKFVGMLVFTVFWNGIVGTIGWVFYSKEIQGGGDVPWFPAIILGLFALIGAGMLLVGLPYQLLAMFNPLPALRLVGGPLRVAAPCRLEWEFHGRVDRLQDYRIELVGREVARYRRGTRTYTDSHEFHRSRLIEHHDPADMLSGSCQLLVPAGLVGSFDGGNNKIEWELQVRGAIAGWPDLSVDFGLEVAPEEAR